jgi:hypothetical protein
VNTPRYVFAHLVSVAVVVAAVGCGSHSETPEPSPQASSSANSSSGAPTPPAPTVSSLFDPRWFGVTPAQPNGWEELNRTITGDFQQFDFRPVNETEMRRRCNGCAPWTATLTAYAPGKFDPTDAQTGQPVSVNGDDDGFFRPLDEADKTKDAMLAWQYADNAWVTAVGMTSTTSGLDQLLELARALKPAERTPIRLPLSLANLPDDIPLAQIDVDTHRDEPGKLDYGTRIDFAACGLTDIGASRGCRSAAESLSVYIVPRDYREPSGGVNHNVVPVKVGGKDGLYDESSFRVSVQLQPGMLVEFEPGGRERCEVLDILANVAWAPDPGNEATWPVVADWTK